eukprot:1878114-Rhodomonas_salina.7
MHRDQTDQTAVHLGALLFNAGAARSEEVQCHGVLIVGFGGVVPEVRKHSAAHSSVVASLSQRTCDVWVVKQVLGVGRSDADNVANLPLHSLVQTVVLVVVPAQRKARKRPAHQAQRPFRIIIQLHSRRRFWGWDLLLPLRE